MAQRGGEPTCVPDFVLCIVWERITRISGLVAFFLKVPVLVLVLISTHIAGPRELSPCLPLSEKVWFIRMLRLGEGSQLHNGNCFLLKLSLSHSLSLYAPKANRWSGSDSCCDLAA